MRGIFGVVRPWNASVPMLGGCNDDVLVSELLDRGALPDVDGQRGSALIWAVTHGNYHNTELLLARNAAPNVADEWRKRPLIAAVQRGDSRIIELLVSHGAQVNINDSDGVPALMLAVMNGDVESVKILLRAGADKYARNAQAVTSMQVAQEHPDCESCSTMVKLLESAPEPRNSVDPFLRPVCK